MSRILDSSDPCLSHPPEIVSAALPSSAKIKATGRIASISNLIYNLHVIIVVIISSIFRGSLTVKKKYIVSMLHRQVSRKKKIVALVVPPFFRLCCVFSGILFLPFWIFSKISHQDLPHESFNKEISKRFIRGETKQKHRLAIIIPFIGEGPEAVPPYLELFCMAAGGSAGLVDFLLIHDSVLDGYYGTPCPDNVKFISLSSSEEFSKYMVRVVDHKPENEIALGQSKDRLAKIVAMHIMKYPYVLVEFKPALGHIFADFLHTYTHWGYSDLDILFGDLERWITPDELNDFDIVTYGFGDQDRIYLRGQFTFHKNEEAVNQLWRSCHYLSDMDKRFNDVMTREKVRLLLCVETRTIRLCHERLLIRVPLLYPTI